MLLASLACRREAEARPGPSGNTPPREASRSAPVREEPRTLRVLVQPGDYLHVVATQGSRDVALTLFDPADRQLLRVDSLTAAGAPYPDEELHWVAESAGELRIELTSDTDPKGPQSPSGPSPLRLEAKRPATAADRARTLAETALARAHKRRKTGEKKSCRSGIAPYRQAERSFADLKLPARRAEALFGLSLLLKECLEEKEAALPVLTEALPFFTGRAEAEATLRERRGEVRFDLGDLDGATLDYQRALLLRRRIGDRKGEALTADNLGLTLHQRGHYDDAAVSFDQALDLWQEGDSPGERANTFLNRGQLHLDLGETTPARERFVEALRLYRQAGKPDLEAAALTALGNTALAEGKPDEALPPLEEALALRQPGSRGRAVTLNTLGVAFRHLQRLGDARGAYLEALRIFLRLDDRREQARCLLNLGWLEAETGNDPAALQDFDRALGLFTALGDPPDLAWTLRGKATVLRHRGQLEEAEKSMEAALGEIERRRAGQRSDTTRAAFFGTQQSLYGFSIDLLMEMDRQRPGAGYAAQALEISERALARSLLDALAGSANDPQRGGGGADPEPLDRERSLEAAIEVATSRRVRLAQNDRVTSQQLRGADEEIERLWGDLERVRADLRARSPRYAALTQPRPASAAEIQNQLLDRDTLLLEYRFGEPRSFLWALTRETVQSFELPGRAELAKRVGRTGQLLARSRSGKAEVSARIQLQKLSFELLGRVAPLLPGKRLLVVGDGEIQGLPFAALPEPGGDEPLVAHHEIVSLPSISVLAELRREVAGRAAAPRSLWVLADPDFDHLFPPLPYSRQEAEAILALAPATESTVLLGREASREAVVAGPLRDYRILHFATHGSFVDPAGPGGGRLLLAQVDANGRRVANGALRLADIYKLDLRADLVVLSACQSGLGREVRGEGLVGMTRGFFYAGAERVLVSLWNVNDRVTVELMRIFYQGLYQEGLSPAAALRAAQDAIRREEHWRSPFYWAGFVLQGEYR